MSTKKMQILIGIAISCQEPDRKLVQHPEPQAQEQAPK
jgi:hypothetical protein